MLKILIVDDEKIIRETISTMIDWASLNMEIVGVCKDGIEAFDSIVDEYPDIVLTDIKMPGLSGLDLIEKVQQAELNVEFVILSGYGEFQFAQSAMKYGVKHYLLKPCNEQEIIQVMKECMLVCQEKDIARMDSLIDSLFSEDSTQISRQHYFNLLLSAQNPSLIKTQLIKLMMQASKSTAHPFSMLQMTDYILTLNNTESLEELQRQAENIITAIFHATPMPHYNDCVQKIIEYVSDHLSDSNLSLKWIAENVLFMNADYISKQFVKETNLKFSNYLTELRIEKAKKLLLCNCQNSPTSVAELVGFGNNPQYFGQIFKKYTKMSPSAYIKMMTNPN